MSRPTVSPDVRRWVNTGAQPIEHRVLLLTLDWDAILARLQPLVEAKDRPEIIEGIRLLRAEERS